MFAPTLLAIQCDGALVPAINSTHPPGTINLWTVSMPFLQTTRAIFTDSHFLIPLAVFAIGLALLITLH